MKRAILILSLLAVAWCALLIENATAASTEGPAALPATFDGSVWHNHFKGERPTSNPRITSTVEWALRRWHRHGTPTPLCRPRVLVAPSLNAALGAAEPRGKGHAVGCTLWLDDRLERTRSWSYKLAACSTILHEVGHLGGLDHSDVGVMSPEYSGDGFRVTKRGYWKGDSACSKRIAAERNAKVFAGRRLDGRFDLR